MTYGGKKAIIEGLKLEWFVRGYEKRSGHVSG